MFPEHYASKRLTRTVLIFTERSDQLPRVTDRVPSLPTSPGYVQCRNAAIFPAPHYSDGMCRSASTVPPHVRHHCRNPRRASSSGLWPLPVSRSLRCCCRFPPNHYCSTRSEHPATAAGMQTLLPYPSDVTVFSSESVSSRTVTASVAQLWLFLPPDAVLLNSPGPQPRWHTVH